ncbi:MAG: heme ABC exporter ATP-binding protein CcmA [Parvularcula sp.]
MTNRPFSLSLEARALNVSRGGRIVAAGLNFSLAPGEALTLRGENGTGKTSILRAVAGFSRPAAGEVSFYDNGEPADHAAVCATAVHWLGGGDGIADRLTARENLVFWTGLSGGPIKDADLWLSHTGLLDVKNRLAGQLSTGQRRRLGLCRLLIADRALWLLDEPLSGLDTEGRAQLQDAIDAHRKRGGVALMASHEDGIEGGSVLRLQRMENE